MTRKFFGTDGIRGLTNSEPMTAEMALRVGQAAGAHFLRGDHRHRVVIGKDTRLSRLHDGIGDGRRLHQRRHGRGAGRADADAGGGDADPSMRADLGVMISACHNPFADNGIKLFGPDGYKLSDEDELAIERRLEKEPKLASAEMIGRAKRIDDARGRYIHFAKSTFPEHLRLDGLKIVVDCANGAAYQVAPEALWELGADVIALGRHAQRHSTSTTAAARPIRSCCSETVVASGADIGIALDGDADRLIVVDEKGEMVDGDQLMALIALVLQRRGELQRRRGGRDGDVQPRARALPGEAGHRPGSAPRSATAMCSRRCASSGYNVGGEQSGHIILTDHATTGDGLVAACRCSPRWSRAASRRASCCTCSSRCRSCSRTSASTAARRSRRTASRRASPPPRPSSTGSGRLVIRKSGTEPLIRVMAEGDDPSDGRAAGRRHLRGGAARGVNPFFAFARETGHRAHGQFRSEGASKRCDNGHDRARPGHRRLGFAAAARASRPTSRPSPCSAAMR